MIDQETMHGRTIHIPAAEVKAQLAELVRIEHLKMHKSDTDSLNAIELVQESMSRP